MNEEREEREGHRLPKSEDEKQEEDTEGQTIKGHAKEDEDDDEGKKGDEGRFASDRRLKREVRVVDGATARLSRLGG